MSEATAPTPAAPATKTALVKLQRPIQRGDQTITEVTLREPVGGDMRGLNVQQLNQSDYNALRTLIPRIASPMLLESDFDTMPAADIGAFAGEIIGFFMSAEQMALIEDYFGMDKSAKSTS